MLHYTPSMRRLFLLDLVCVRTHIVRMKTKLKPRQALSLRLIRALAQSYQSFETYAAQHVRAEGLTLTQFDVIATLGNQPPMTCKELGEKTLILKATLTGVLDRLHEKGLIQKIPHEVDGRSYRVALSREGERVFERLFVEHAEHLSRALSSIDEAELRRLTQDIWSVHSAFSSQLVHT